MSKCAFVAMPFSGKFENLYETVILPSLSESSFKAVRVDQLSQSTNIVDDIHSNIVASDIVIVEATESNRNVYYELGLAQGYGKEVVILARKSTKLPFDTMTIRHIFYEDDDLEATKILLKQWLQTSKAARSAKRKSVLFRGGSSLDLIDAATAKRWAKLSLRNELFENIRQGQMISCGFAYGTEIGAQNWLNLCADPLYEVYSESVKNIRDKIGSLLSLIEPNKLDEVPDVISIGPGDGSKDKVILDHLDKYWARNNIPHQSNYYPVDVSQLIIATAIQNILTSNSLATRFRVKSINGDFESLSVFDAVFNYRTSSNIFLFLGNTLGNYNTEMKILAGLKNCMSPDDILILEVRRKAPRNILLSGDTENQFALSFSPLRYLGVEFDPSKVSQRLTTGFSQVPNTQSIIVSYSDVIIDGKQFEDISLSCVNFYDETDLVSAIESPEIGLEVLGSNSSDRMILLALKKKPI